jgi:hypothetical protein
MPSAVPYQQGLIGLYNNSHGNPGVYVSWDPNINYATTQSLIFKGIDNSGYRFPLVVSSLSTSGTTQRLTRPVAIGAGSTYNYLMTQSQFVVYRKQQENFNTIFSTNSTGGTLPAFLPNTLKVYGIGSTEYLLLGYDQANQARIYNYGVSTLNYVKTINYNDITGLSVGIYTNSYIEVDDNNVYLTYGGGVYGCGYTGNFILNTSNRGQIINTTNGVEGGATLIGIACYDSSKIAAYDNLNNVYEWAYDGDISLGNNSSQWSNNYVMAPTQDSVWSNIIYNHFGIIVATDTYNSNVSVIASANLTVNTDTYGFNGVGYQIVSTDQSSSISGQVTNRVGSQGVGYQQFDTPIGVAEDNEFNIMVIDRNNRITYIPTALTFLASVQAPLNEYIDGQGNPADVYYIVQTNLDYSSVIPIPPTIGDELLLKSSVLYELNALLRVPIYDEEPLFGYNRTSAQLAYGDIVTDPAPQVRITCSTNNGQRSPMFVLNPYTGFYNSLDQSLSDPFSAPSSLLDNYPSGLFYRFNNQGVLMFFNSLGEPVSLQEYDTILVTYYVKMFTNTQINNALYLALQAINSQPGTNKMSSVAGVPFWYDQALVSGATYYLLRQLIVGLNQRERRLLVMDPDSGSYDAVANLKTTADMYKEEFNELLKKLPIAVRPIMGSITVPEYAMPGGRSRMFRMLWKGGAS